MHSWYLPKVWTLVTVECFEGDVSLRTSTNSSVHACIVSSIKILLDFGTTYKVRLTLDFDLSDEQDSVHGNNRFVSAECERTSTVCKTLVIGLGDLERIF